MGCEHSTSEELHKALWDVFFNYKERFKKLAIKVLAGPYDCPSGARVIFDLPMDEELFENGRPSEHARACFDELCNMVYKLRETGASHKQSVTVKVTFLSKPTPDHSALA